MSIAIPKDQLMEMDGVPLIGKLSATDAKATIDGNKLKISWTPVDKSGSANIWIATTNHFKTGGKDDYTLMATVPVQKGNAEVNVTGIPSGFYKVVIQMPFNMLNRWVIVKN